MPAEEWLEFELRLRPPPGDRAERDNATAWVTRQLALLTRAYERVFLPGGPTTLAPAGPATVLDDVEHLEHGADVVRLRPLAPEEA